MKPVEGSIGKVSAGFKQPKKGHRRSQFVTTSVSHWVEQYLAGGLHSTIS